MCARFSLSAPGSVIASLFELEEIPELQPSYNIAPTDPAGVVVHEHGENSLLLMRWGLVPSWMREVPKAPTINARSESVLDKPMFRGAFKYRRCVVPASGYFEWREEKGKKQPYFIHYADGEPLAFAGLWELFEDGVHHLLSFAMITTDAGARTCEIHDRMPVILPQDKVDLWLQTKPEDSAKLSALLQPNDDERLTYYPVDPRMSNPRFKEPEAVVPFGTPGLFS